MQDLQTAFLHPFHDISKFIAPLALPIAYGFRQVVGYPGTRSITS